MHRPTSAAGSPYPAENPTLLPQTWHVANASWYKKLRNPLQETPQGSTLDGNPRENHESQRPDNTRVGKSTRGMCCHNIKVWAWFISLIWGQLASRGLLPLGSFQWHQRPSQHTGGVVGRGWKRVLGFQAVNMGSPREPYLGGFCCATADSVCLLWVWGAETSPRTETSQVRPSDWGWGRAAPPAMGMEEGALAVS